MGWAKCKRCRRTTRFAATRGSRLADLACMHCGGELEGLTAGRPGSHEGYGYCVLCRKRRRLHNLVRLRDELRSFDHVAPAGAVVCGYHERRADAGEGRLLAGMAADIGDPLGRSPGKW
jgi:Zn ribbon nucleic-acid-binding protein